MNKVCECGHYMSEHGPLLVRGALIPRYRRSEKDPKIESVGNGCVWCDCDEFRRLYEAMT